MAAPKVGDPVRLVHVFGSAAPYKHVAFPGFVLSTRDDGPRRLRPVEGEGTFEEVNDSDDPAGAVDITDMPTPGPGRIHVVYFTALGSRTAIDVPLDKKKGAREGWYVEP